MKKLLPALLFIIFSFSVWSVKAQYVTIPDTVFVNYLNAHGFSQCMSGNQLDTTCTAVLTATSINFYQYNIHTLHDITGITYFKNLQELICIDDSLTFLPPLPQTLTKLYCSGQKLTSLPRLPSGITFLEVSGNLLTYLDTLPTVLGILGCNQNLLTSLPELPVSLTTLDCAQNPLVYLPDLPPYLDRLNCERCELDSLPSLPPHLRLLYCSVNNLTHLPALPLSLDHLTCTRNLLTTLPVFPMTYMMSIDAGYNNLTNLSSLPDTVGTLSLDENTQLHCLPDFKQIYTISLNNTGITCLPNYGSIQYSFPALSTFLLCDVFNPYGCEVFWNISGKTYLDEAKNCIDDVNDTPLQNIKILLHSSGNVIEQKYSIQGGLFSLNTDSMGNYTTSIDTTNLPFHVLCPANNSYTSVISASDSFDTQLDFALECKLGFDLTALAVEGRFVPGRVSQVNSLAGDMSNYYNIHCASGISGTVQLVINGPVTYVAPAAGSLTPDYIGNDTIQWWVSDFGSVNLFSGFNIMVLTDTTAQINQPVCFTLTVNSLNGDYNPTNNSLLYCAAVVSSFDPNEKEVYPSGNIDTAQEWLTYTIHFQNTGTAEAEHIYVDDTLDTDLDASSFQLLAYSHQPVVQLKGNTVRFNFPNINLPDSNTNEPLSHGYVQYKIKLKDNLPIGTTINNTAYIYFDFNAPVVTNTTTNTISTNTGIQTFSNQHSEFRIYPNPASNSVNIAVTEDLLNSTLTITDIAGRQMTAVLLLTVNRELSTDGLSNGVYFATIRKDGGVYSKKLMIQR